MAFPLPLALVLPLAIVAAEAVPRFSVEPTCKGGMDSPGMNERYSRCIEQENDARQKLEASWAQWPAGDRTTCADTARMGTPSYVQMLTCLELARDAARLKKN